MFKIKMIIFAMCSLISAIYVSAQDNGPKHKFDKEAFLAKRNAYITAEVGLTPEEAAAFIPLCNELQDKMFELGKDCMKLSREIRTNSDAKDKDYDSVLDECISVNLKQAQLEQEYYKKFREILSSKKLLKYRMAEGKFAREFMKRGEPQKNKK
jgi:hypothetical protein